MTEDSETNLVRRMMLAMSKVGARVFRNNVGDAWIGKVDGPFSRTEMVTVNAGDVVIRHGRRFHAGLCKGSSDIIGFMPVKITQAMVGTTVAVFIGAEAKTATGRPTDEQILFCNAVKRFGGRAGIVRSEQEAVDLALGGLV